MFRLVNTTGKSIDQQLAIALVNESGKGEGLFPKEIDHVFQAISPLFDEALIILERVSFVAPFALQVGDDMRHSKLRFAQSGG